MAHKNKNRGGRESDSGRQDISIGNKQRTAETGGQNAGGRNRNREDDEFSDDLRKSGNRTSSNTKGRS